MAVGLQQLFEFRGTGPKTVGPSFETPPCGFIYLHAVLAGELNEVFFPSRTADAQCAIQVEHHSTNQGRYLLCHPPI